jgi:TonB family protein
MKQKIKIMKQRPQLSDEEIRSYMDFDSLIANRKLAMNKSKFQLLKWIVPAIAFLTIGAWLIFSPVEENKQSDRVVAETNVTSAPNNPVTTPSSNEESATVETQTEKKTSDVEDLVKESSTPIRKNDDNKSTEKKSVEDIYVQAEPADGYSALYAYFNSNLVYPSEAIKDSIQGVETVSFVINQDGKPEKITIRQSLGEPFEKEARRLIENMPLWKPATLNGKPVPSQMSIPLTFQIQKVNVNR